MNKPRNLVPELTTLATIQHSLYILLFGLLILAILPFFLLIFYAHPSADDYCYANVFITGDFWQDVIGEYMAWKGRYFGIFVTVLFHKSGSMIENYQYPLILFLTFLFVAFYFFVRSAFEEKGPFAQIFYCAFALGVYYIVSMPKVSASLYWTDGAFQYQVGSIFYLLALASLLKLYRQHESPVWPTLLSVLFIFAAIGSSEVFMISLLSIVGLMFLYKYFIQKQNRIAWSIVLVVTIASTALLVLSPGNAIRMAIDSEAGQFWFSVRHSIYSCGNALGTWISQPSFWLLNLLFIPVALHLVYMSRIRRNVNWISVFLILVVLFWQIWFSFFATWWAAAEDPPGRTLNTLYLLFLVGWFLFILEFIAALAKYRRLVYVDSIFSTPVRIMMIFCTALFCFLLVTKTHVPEAYVALTGPAQEYDRKMKERYAYIEHKRSVSGYKKLSLSVETIENAPRILVFSDIKRNSKKWPNGCVATYFGLSAIDRK